jgi:hypothetical protein
MSVCLYVCMLAGGDGRAAGKLRLEADGPSQNGCGGADAGLRTVLDVMGLLVCLVVVICLLCLMLVLWCLVYCSLVCLVCFIIAVVGVPEPKHGGARNPCEAAYETGSCHY